MTNRIHFISGCLFPFIYCTNSHCDKHEAHLLANSIVPFKMCATVRLLNQRQPTNGGSFTGFIYNTLYIEAFTAQMVALFPRVLFSENSSTGVSNKGPDPRRHSSAMQDTKAYCSYLQYRTEKGRRKDQGSQTHFHQRPAQHSVPIVSR